MTTVGVADNGERNPSSLSASDFATYPASARLFAIAQIAILRTFPLVLCVLVLKQIAKFDKLFPVEREDLSQLLLMTSSQQFVTTVSAFGKIVLSAELKRRDWITKPSEFVELMTNELWTSGQIDDFRHAAAQLPPPVETQGGTMSRLVIVDFDSALEKPNFVLFRRLLPHGTLFTNLTHNLGDGPFIASLNAVEDRARALPSVYSHWLICGDSPPRRPSSAISAIDYKTLAPVRRHLLDLMSAAVNGGTNGPEGLRSAMMDLQPESLGITSSDSFAANPLLAQFCIDLLAQGSGTQVYSTSFVQWSAREALRRARPATVLIRFTPRVRQRPTNQQWSEEDSELEFDLAGSLVDADMAAYYMWINLNRLSGASSSNFVAFHSGRGQAFASGPGLPGGASSGEEISPLALLSLLH